MVTTLPVPAQLELVRAFVNTYDVEDGVDSISTPQALSAWLAERGLAPSGLTATRGDAKRAVLLREALRDHLLANNGVELPPQAAEAVERQCERSGLSVRIHGGAAALTTTATGVDGALGRILVAVAIAMLDESWPRLKACAAESCRWAYVDESRNRSRHWCAMRVCGNREKVKAFRARQAGASTT